MSEYMSGISVPSRNVFDALLQWNESTEKVYGELPGLEEYIYAVEGAVLDFDDPSLMDDLSAYLWDFLRVMRETESAASETKKKPLPFRELMLALLHTALLRILESGRDGVHNLPGSRDPHTPKIDVSDRSPRVRTP